MSFEILCRGVLGVATGISAAIIKGAIFGGPLRSTLAEVRGPPASGPTNTQQ